MHCDGYLFLNWYLFFCLLTCSFHLGENTCEESLHRIRQVLANMEAVSNLNRLWRASRSRASVLRTSVAAHMGDLWMGGNPHGSPFCLPVRQDVNDLVRVQVYNDCAECSAAPKRKIIEAQALYMLGLRSGQRHHPAYNRHPGGGDAQVRGQTRAESATGR